MNADAIRSFAAFTAALATHAAARGFDADDHSAAGTVRDAETICALARRGEPGEAGALNEIAATYGLTLDNSGPGPDGCLLQPDDGGQPVPIPDLPADLALSANTTRHLVLLHWIDDECGPPAMWEFTFTAGADVQDREATFEREFTLALRAHILRADGVMGIDPWDLAHRDFLADLARHGIEPWRGPVGYTTHDWYEGGYFFHGQDDCGDDPDELAWAMAKMLIDDDETTGWALDRVGSTPFLTREALAVLLAEELGRPLPVASELVRLMCETGELDCDDAGVLWAMAEDDDAAG